MSTELHNGSTAKNRHTKKDLRDIEIIRLADEFYSRYEISKKVGCSTKTVYKVINSANKEARIEMSTVTSEMLPRRWMTSINKKERWINDLNFIKETSSDPYVKMKSIALADHIDDKALELLSYGHTIYQNMFQISAIQQHQPYQTIQREEIERHRRILESERNKEEWSSP